MEGEGGSEGTRAEETALVQASDDGAGPGWRQRREGCTEGGFLVLSGVTAQGLDVEEGSRLQTSLPNSTGCPSPSQVPRCYVGGGKRSPAWKGRSWAAGAPPAPCPPPPRLLLLHPLSGRQLQAKKRKW